MVVTAKQFDDFVKLKEGGTIKCAKIKVILQSKRKKVILGNNNFTLKL